MGTKQYAVIDTTAELVVNIVDIVDQELLPAAPLESEKPVAPAAPTFLPEPFLPASARISSDPESTEIRAMYDAEYAAWSKDCEIKQRVYEVECAEYNAALNDFAARTAAANRNRWTPPEGHTAIVIPAGALVIIGVTKYERGEFVNPPVDKAVDSPVESSVEPPAL